MGCINTKDNPSNSFPRRHSYGKYQQLIWIQILLWNKIQITNQILIFLLAKLGWKPNHIRLYNDVFNRFLRYTLPSVTDRRVFRHLYAKVLSLLNIERIILIRYLWVIRRKQWWFYGLQFHSYCRHQAKLIIYSQYQYPARPSWQSDKRTFFISGWKNRNKNCCLTCFW